MKTVEMHIRNCADEGNKAFVAYMMAGDGGLGSLKEKVLFLQEAGVTAIEIGIPFSDPVADGEVIQRAGERALAEGVTLRKVLTEIEGFQAEVAVPLIIMTYLNPVLAIGMAPFVERCREAGVRGLIIPDLPLEESGPLRVQLQGTDIALIPLVSLTSSDERIAELAASAEGFIYAVTVNGITGVRNAFGEELSSHLKRVKSLSGVPVLAGFGVATPEHAMRLGADTDGVIVGSAIVDAFHKGDLESIRELVQNSTGRFKIINSR